MLSVNNLNFYYHSKKIILRDISFDLEKNDVLCLLGPNGTGKTTLMRCILGISHIKSGQIKINGNEISHISNRKRARLLAYVPQSVSITFPYAAGEMVLMGCVSGLRLGEAPGKKEREAAKDAMRQLDILHLEHTLFQELSGGEKQLVLVARAIAQNAAIFVMDEPTANLDYGNQVKMLRVVKRLASEGYAILMSTHFPDHAFLIANRVALISGGVIMAQGPPDAIVTTETLTRLYKTEVRVSETKIKTETDHIIKMCVPII